MERSVSEAAAGEPRVAVAFSGGLDSSLVARCAMNCTRVVACAAWAEGSADALRASEGARALGVELVSTELDDANVGAALSAMDLPFAPTLMDRSLWCLYYVVSRSARAAGAKVILLGQLADELFGGYAKYAEALRKGGEEAAKSLMDFDLKEYQSRGRIRDVGACSPWVEPRLPFEAQGLVEFASALPVTFRIRDGVRKAVLRRAASILGVPEGQADAAKKAAQYSSGVQRLVARAHF